MKPVCVPCQRFCRLRRDGYWFLVGRPICGNPAVGRAEPDKWQPYKLWNGDLWECPDCGVQIISGVAPYPAAEHSQPTFTEIVKNVGGDQLQVNDY